MRGPIITAALIAPLLAGCITLNGQPTQEATLSPEQIAVIEQSLFGRLKDYPDKYRLLSQKAGYDAEKNLHVCGTFMGTSVVGSILGFRSRAGYAGKFEP